MTEYQEGWLTLMNQRDTTYLVFFAFAGTAYHWYHLWLRRFWYVVLVLAVLVVGAALVWGYTQIGLV